MKKSNVEVGQVYSAKVSGNVVPVRIDRANARGGWDGTNMVTKKAVRIKSAQRLRGKAATWPGKRSEPTPEPAVEVGPRAEKSAEAAATPAKPEKPARGKRGAKGAKRASGLDAAAQVLAEAGEPLNTKTMVEGMLAKNLWKTNGKTPAATIYAAIIREIAVKGDKARFRKVERGKFELAN